MRILGIDPSLTCTGWAIIEDGKAKESGTIKTKPTDIFARRLRIIRRELTEYAIHGAFCHAVAIEDGFVNRKNPLTAVDLGIVKGSIIACVQDGGFKDKDIYFYAPKFVKVTITGSGNATKEQVLKMVQLQSGYKGKQFDESDAIAVALTCEREISSGVISR